LEWARNTNEGHKNTYKCLVGNCDGRVHHLKGVNVSERIILKRVVMKHVDRMPAGFVCFRTQTNVGLL